MCQTRALQALMPTAANQPCTLAVAGGFSGCKRVTAYAGLGSQPERALGRWGRRECDSLFEHEHIAALLASRSIDGSY